MVVESSITYKLLGTVHGSFLISDMPISQMELEHIGNDTSYRDNTGIAFTFSRNSYDT